MVPALLSHSKAQPSQLYSQARCKDSERAGKRAAELRTAPLCLSQWLLAWKLPLCTRSLLQGAVMLGQTGREQGGCSRHSSLKYRLEQSVQRTVKNASVGPRDGMDSSGVDGRWSCAAELAPGHGAVILPASPPLWLLHVLCPSRLFPSQMLSLTPPSVEQCCPAHTGVQLMEMEASCFLGLVEMVQPSLLVGILTMRD